MHHLAPYAPVGAPAPSRKQVADKLRLLHGRGAGRPTTPPVASTRERTNISPSDAPMLSWSSVRSPRRPRAFERTPPSGDECLHNSACRCRACCLDYDALHVTPPARLALGTPAPVAPSHFKQAEADPSIDPPGAPMHGPTKSVATRPGLASTDNQPGPGSAATGRGEGRDAPRPRVVPGVPERSELRCRLEDHFDTALTPSATPESVAPRATSDSLPERGRRLFEVEELPPLLKREELPPLVRKEELPPLRTNSFAGRAPVEVDDSLDSLRAKLQEASQHYRRLNEQRLHELCHPPPSVATCEDVCTNASAASPSDARGAMQAPDARARSPPPPQGERRPFSQPADANPWAITETSEAQSERATSCAAPPTCSEWLASQVVASLQAQQVCAWHTSSPSLFDTP